MSFTCDLVVREIEKNNLDCDPEIFHVIHIALTSPDTAVAKEVDRLKQSDEGMTSKGLHFVYANLIQTPINPEDQIASMKRSRGHIEAIRTSAETSIRLCEKNISKPDNEECARDVSENLSDIIRHTKDLELELIANQIEIFIDPLTGIPNRRYLEAELKAKLAEQENDTFIALLDIDHFKTVNDQHGHIVGDQVLKLIATQIKKLIRPQDILCRYGGEEFALLFRMTPQETCLSVIESVRKGVAKQNIQNRRSGEFMGSITLSAGLSKVHAGDDFESAIERSDRLLYIAKNRGRNQVAF